MALYRSSVILLLCLSSLVAAAPYTLKGCYQEVPGRIFRDGSTVSQNGMTLEYCASFCTGYKYFGVEWSIECYCSDSIYGAVQTASSDCNYACSGNSSQTCGGSNRLSVYKDAAPPAPTVQGQCTISYTNPDVAMVGSAYRDATAQSFVLTDPVHYVVGGIWGNKLVKVTEDFRVSFTFKLTHDPTDTTPGCRTPSSPVATADGIVFVVSPNKNTTIGSGAKHIGYNFKNNFAVEFDSYQNTDYQDPAPFHIGVQSCGTAQNSGDHSGSCKITDPVSVNNQCFDNVAHTAVIQYTASSKILTVTYDSVLYQTVTYDFAANLDLITGDRAYVGFTSSTGGQLSRHEITSFDYNCQVPTPPTTAAPTTAAPPTQCTLDPSSAASMSLINVVGSAVRDPITPSYIITPASTYKAGAIWIKKAITVTTAFQVDFKFNLTHKPNTYTGCKSYYPGGQTADGIAFVINAASNNKVGTGAQSLGFNTLPNTLAIEFDTYKNKDYFDTNFAHVGVQSCGTKKNSPNHGPTGCAIVPPANFSTQCFDNIIHTARVTYDGTSIFKVIMNGVQVQSFTFPLATNLALINSTKAYIGITGSTGGQFSRQEVNFLSYPCS